MGKNRSTALTVTDTGHDWGAFIRRAAHDLANPFNAISMNVEFAKMLLQRGEQAKSMEMLDQAIADCARCTRMIQGMQGFGAALNTTTRENICAREVVDGAIVLLKQRRQELPSIRFGGDGSSCIRVSRAALEGAIAGLLDNAVEAGSSVIDILFRRDDHWIVIELADNGGGIDDKLRESVIEGFVTTRRAEGHTGLGLTLASEIVRLHEGRLTIRDNNQAGTKIELRFPIANSAD